MTGGVIVGFTGTRSGMTFEQVATVRRLVAEFAPTLAVHGMAAGADSEFDRLCVIAGIERKGWPASADSERFVRPDTIMHVMKPLDRDKRIVADADVMIATPWGAEIQRSGTWATVRYARKAGKPIHIVWPDGSVTVEPQL